MAWGSCSSGRDDRKGPRPCVVLLSSINTSTFQAANLPWGFAGMGSGLSPPNLGLYPFPFPCILLHVSTTSAFRLQTVPLASWAPISCYTQTPMVDSNVCNAIVIRSHDLVSQIFWSHWIPPHTISLNVWWMNVWCLPQRKKWQRTLSCVQQSCHSNWRATPVKEGVCVSRKLGKNSTSTSFCRENMKHTT